MGPGSDGRRRGPQAGDPYVGPPPVSKREPGRWKRSLAPWFAGLPYAGLAVFWIGILATAESMAGLSWLSGMWVACVVFMPMGVLGAIWAGQLKERGTMWWGIAAAVLCLPGFGIGLVFLAFMLHTAFR